MYRPKSFPRRASRAGDFGVFQGVFREIYVKPWEFFLGALRAPEFLRITMHRQKDFLTMLLEK